MSAATDPLPTGVVTFLLTDIEGSTQAWQAAPGEMTELVSRHYDILESGIAAHGGRRPQEQGEGDSVVAVFTDARRALAAAVDTQLALRRELAGRRGCNWATSAPRSTMQIERRSSPTRRARRSC